MKLLALLNQVFQKTINLEKNVNDLDKNLYYTITWIFILLRRCGLGPFLLNDNDTMLSSRGKVYESKVFFLFSFFFAVSAALVLSCLWY